MNLIGVVRESPSRTSQPATVSCGQNTKLHLGEASAEGRHHGVGGRQSPWAKVTPADEKEKQVTISTPKQIGVSRRCFLQIFWGFQLYSYLFCYCSKLSLVNRHAHILDGTAQSGGGDWAPTVTRPSTVVAFPVGYAFLFLRLLNRLNPHKVSCKYNLISTKMSGT